MIIKIYLIFFQYILINKVLYLLQLYSLISITIIEFNKQIIFNK